MIMIIAIATILYMQREETLTNTQCNYLVRPVHNWHYAQKSLGRRFCYEIVIFHRSCHWHAVRPGIRRSTHKYFVCPTEIPQPPFAWKYYKKLFVRSVLCKIHRNGIIRNLICKNQKCEKLIISTTQ